MERIITDALIYKVNKYADSSAVASAYTYDYGKIRVFIPQAFSKKRGVYTLIPGEIDFLKKENSDLCKLYSFRPYTEYMDYASIPEISLRLSLFFDIYDKFYGIEQQDSVFWKIITSYKSLKEYSKINLFGIYAVLRNTGHMFEFKECGSCGKSLIDEEEIYLSNNICYCSNCKVDNYFTINSYSFLILKAFEKKELYKNIKINRHNELAILDMFNSHIESITDNKLKSIRLFKEMILSL